MINELRIGNYIKFHGNSTDYHKMTLLDFAEIHDDSSEMQYYNPIPITEEILLKFGFEERKHENGNSYKLLIHYHNGYKDYIDMCNKGSWISFITTNGSDGWVFPKEIKYVHQLQNIYYSLTYKELTFKK